MSPASPTPRVILIGSGTCRIDSRRGPVSGCVITGDITYLIDLGVGALERLDNAGAFENCRELHIHISHGHIDHAWGVPPLLQCLTWADDARFLQIKRVIIHATNSVCSLLERTFSLWGNEQTQLVSTYPGCNERTLEFQSGPDADDWSYTAGPLAIQSVHLPAHNNHGVLFAIENTTYAFTCDAAEVSEKLTSFCSRADICVFDLGHISFERTAEGRFSLSLERAAKLLAEANPPKAYAAHVYLRHLQHRRLTHEERACEVTDIINKLTHQAIEYGFQGTLFAAEDGMILSMDT